MDIEDEKTGAESKIVLDCSLPNFFSGGICEEFFLGVMTYHRSRKQ